MGGTFCAGLRALSSLRIFKEYRIFIKLFLKTFKDMTTFLLLLLYIIVLFTLLNVIYFYSKPEKEQTFGDFFKLLIEQYQVMFGENPDPDKLDKFTTLWFTYWGFTIIVNIVALNLLIAVISNTYDQVQANIPAGHLRTKAEILNTLGEFMYWNRGKTERKFLHFVHVAAVDFEQTIQEKFAGRIKTITNKVDESVK